MYRSPLHTTSVCTLLFLLAFPLTGCNRIEARTQIAEMSAAPTLRREVYNGPARPHGAHRLRAEQSGIDASTEMIIAASCTEAFCSLPAPGEK